MGIFYKKMNKEAALVGMIAGILAMLFCIPKFKFDMFRGGTSKDW